MWFAGGERGHVWCGEALQPLAHRRWGGGGAAKKMKGMQHVRCLAFDDFVILLI